MIKRKKIKKEKVPIIPDTEEAVLETEPDLEQVVEQAVEQAVEKEWKEDLSGKIANSKICKPCLKRETCPFGRGAAVICCDKIEIKKKRVSKK